MRQLVLLEADKPCGGGNQCLQEREQLAGDGNEPTALVTFPADFTGNLLCRQAAPAPSHHPSASGAAPRPPAW